MSGRLLYLSLIYYLTLATRIECSQAYTGLRATLVNATLPIGLAYFSTQSVFDGKDSIYLFGGFSGDMTERCIIFHYSISLDVIKCVGNLSESSGIDYGISYVTSNLGKNEKIYFSASRSGPFNLYEFDPITNHVRKVEVPIPPPRLGYRNIAVTNSGSLIFMSYGSAQNTTVYEWHVNATTYRTITQLPSVLSSGSAHYLPDSNKMLIVEPYGNTMALLDVETGQTEILHSFLSTIKPGISAVVNGVLFRFGYVDEVILQKFIWYDLAEQHHEMIEIQNFAHNNTTITRQTGVYVPHLNRVYIFGGYIHEVELYVKDIWYVDMTPMDIPTICGGMRVGAPCVDIGCSRCGFCWGNASFYLQCNASTSQIIRDKCDPGLWWNPLEKPQHLDIGGACDQWKNLPLEIRQHYERDSSCVTPHCLWGQYERDRCTKKYWHSNENGDKENVECGGDLVWDNVKQQCRLCKNVSGCQC